MVDFHKRILFSDEAHFWLNGYVSKHNCRIWSEAHPQVYVETQLHPEKLTVWCALWADFEQKAAPSSTYIAIGIVSSYLAFVLWIGPAYMTSRKPYNLRKTLIVYNFLQAFLSGFVFCEFLTFLAANWDMRCMTKNHPNLKVFLKTSGIPVWHYYLLKFVDLLDTVSDY
ncbi:elongation of very long chain fatty acids protein [Trichonephila clavipes]|nr:elongation of very long chain fatty acids protein [Trichonephila clavipes]